MEDNMISSTAQATENNENRQAQTSETNISQQALPSFGGAGGGILIRNITKSFGSLQVLKGIDLEIKKGEIVSIVGPSGAGKTTLLQIIGTLDRPDTGSVCVDGIDTTTLSQKQLSDFRNQHIGFVFQFHQLLPEFTAIENVMIPAFIAGKATARPKGMPRNCWRS